MLAEDYPTKRQEQAERCQLFQERNVLALSVRFPGQPFQSFSQYLSKYEPYYKWGYWVSRNLFVSKFVGSPYVVPPNNNEKFYMKANFFLLIYRQVFPPQETAEPQFCFAFIDTSSDHKKQRSPSPLCQLNPRPLENVRKKLSALSQSALLFLCQMLVGWKTNANINTDTQKHIKHKHRDRIQRQISE